MNFRPPAAAMVVAATAIALAGLTGCGGGASTVSEPGPPGDGGTVRVINQENPLAGHDKCASIKRVDRSHLAVEGWVFHRLLIEIGDEANDHFKLARQGARRLISYCDAHGEQTLRQATKQALKPIVAQAAG